jgi:hypothetical protein
MTDGHGSYVSGQKPKRIPSPALMDPPSSAPHSFPPGGTSDWLAKPATGMDCHVTSRDYSPSPSADRGVLFRHDTGPRACLPLPLGDGGLRGLMRCGPPALTLTFSKRAKLYPHFLPHRGGGERDPWSRASSVVLQALAEMWVKHSPEGEGTTYLPL